MTERTEQLEAPPPAPPTVVLKRFSEIPASLEPSRNATVTTTDRALLHLAALALDQRTKPKDARFILRRARKMVRRRGIDVARWLRRVEGLLKADDLKVWGVRS